jgi:uncharacterized protein (DUF58 family)
MMATRAQPSGVSGLDLSPQLVATGQALGARLPAIVMDARRAAATLTHGMHGRRRAGAGEAFWQHRELATGEGLRQVDWRHSARSDRLFVREKEREAPAVLQIWLDGSPGMAWSGHRDRITKQERALVLALGLAIAAKAGGEKVSVLGSQQPMTSEMGLALGLLQAGQDGFAAARPGQVLVLTDGLEPPGLWAERARLVRGARAELLVVLVADPAEYDFPFAGRVEFTGKADTRPFVVGRAEAARNEYQAAYLAHIGAVQAAIHGHGGQVLRHVTDAGVGPIALLAAESLDGRTASQRQA